MATSLNYGGYVVLPLLEREFIPTGLTDQVGIFKSVLAQYMCI